MFIAKHGYFTEAELTAEGIRDLAKKHDILEAQTREQAIEVLSRIIGVVKSYGTRSKSLSKVTLSVANVAYFEGLGFRVSPEAECKYDTTTGRYRISWEVE
jgi:hypothetical protein